MNKHSVIKQSNKVLYMEIKQRRFIDSINLVPGALKSYSKTFGLEEEKGHTSLTYLISNKIRIILVHYQL